MSNEIRKALCECEINLGPVIVKCAVLENKERVISQREVVKAITGNAKGGLDRYLQPQNLQPYIPIKFKSQSLDQAEMIMRSLAKTGIIALIDEATGYEKIRETGELIKFFKETMVREIASDKIKEFDKRGLFDGIYKIYNLKRKNDKPWQHLLLFSLNKYIITKFCHIYRLVTNPKLNALTSHARTETPNS